MSSIFSKIVRGDLPAYKIAEDEYHLAFLDIFPLAKGHVLVIPKEEIDNIFDMSPEKYSLLWMFAQRVAIRIRKVIHCERIGVSVIGLEVPHAHIHLVPINTISDINFEAEKINFSEGEFEEIAKSIREAI
tara:strand:- start:1804 stop:2196 length:393 start_codon:yes stop_codon:yes gene_type:complete